jgi:hypothetical protein
LPLPEFHGICALTVPINRRILNKALDLGTLLHMHPAPSPGKHTALVERITAMNAALRTTIEPDTRHMLLEELGAATRELMELIVEKEGRLKSPLE